MIFLVAYDVKSSKRVTLSEFPESQRAEAVLKKHELERKFLAQISHVEIALFESRDLETFQQTHRRYFVGTLEELSNDLLKKAASG